MTFNCAIATPHRLATEAGRKAVEDGGNAVDAALAAAAVLTVVYPHMCSIGGDMFALVGRAGEAPVAINASGAAAAATDVEGLVRRYGTMPTGGIETVTVPGVLSGWDELASLGSLQDNSIYVEAAAAYARDGVPVAQSLADSIGQDRSSMLSDEGMRGVFAPDGKPLGVGDSLIQPELAKSLEAIAEGGTEAFYGGEVGERFIMGIRRLGSVLSLADLAGQHATRAEPLTLEFGGHQVFTSPPATQGMAFLEMLKALAVADLDEPLGKDADLLAWIARLVSDDRDRYLADPSREEVPVARLLSDEHATRLLDRAQRGLRGELRSSIQPPRPTGDTVAIATVDSDGRAVSLIQSIFHSFGSGILEPSTGIICQNRGACFTLDPGSPNRIAPGKRPAHTLMPVLIQDGSGRVSAHGTMGGRAQPQIHTQLLLRRLNGLDPQEAVSAPRFVIGGLDAGSEADIVFAEENLDRGASSALARTGFEISSEGELDEIVGHAVLAVSTRDGLDAASDPRSDGSSAIAGTDNHP